MTTFVDLVAGTTTTTGTGSYAISGSVDGFRPFSVVADSTELTVYVSLGSDYELVTGVVSGTGTTLTRASVIRSSNSDAAVNWGAGTKTMRVVASAAMLKGEELSTLDDADTLDGSELMPVLQSGVASKTTPDDVAGPPVTHMMTHGRDKIRVFSHLLGTPYTFSSSTTGDVWGADMAEIWASGTGSSVAQGTALLFRYGVAVCSTGTTTSGYGGITSTLAPIFLVEASSVFDARILASPSHTPGATNDYTAQVGIFTDPTVVAAQGVFFRGNDSQTNWIAVSKNTGGETTADTGVVCDTSWHTFRIYYDFNVGNVVYYIDGTQVASLSANFPGVIATHLGGVIHKTAGTSNRQLRVDSYSLDILDASASGTYF